MITLNEKHWKANYEVALAEINLAIDRAEKLLSYGKEMGFDTQVDAQPQCPSCRSERARLQRRLDNQT